jgi:glycosyltransferase involved in cell wall biosynthesis
MTRNSPVTVNQVVRAVPRTLRAAVICDFAEEAWPSMDLVGDMLLEALQQNAQGNVEATRIRPSMKQRLGWSPCARGLSRNMDRLWNRFYDYPRELRRRRGEFDIFHITDHSYAQLVHELPAERTVVTCHDLDTFRCLLNPAGEPRGRLFRQMSRRILNGMRRAARVICVSGATREDLLRHKLVEAARLHVIPNGVHPAFSDQPDAQADRKLMERCPPGFQSATWLMHVGSTEPRKRLDVLLEVFARVHRILPATRLLRVGRFRTEQRDLLERLSLGDAVLEIPDLETRLLAAAYRRAAVVLQPSDREGFGLPVAEALTCGTVVVASGISALRETGGEAATYCVPGDVEEWTAKIVKLLDQREYQPVAWAIRRRDAVRQGCKFSWTTHADAVLKIYRELYENGTPCTE